MSGLRSDLRRVVAGHTAAGATAMSAMVAAVVPAFSVALAAQAPPPPPPSAAAAWCPTYHTIKDHYDPSGPSYEPTTEIWHVFPDTAGSVDGDDADKVCNHGWCHLFSKDLLRWHVQNETAAGGFPLANGDTGSISFTENGTIALFPTTKGAFGLLRQVPAGGGPLTPRMTWTNASHVYSATFDGARAGFRDPARALKMADGSYYVAVGAGVGKEGCIAWLRAGDASLTSFEFVGCLLSTNHTTGHMDTQHYGWDPKDLKVSFIECPDVFKLGSKYIALGSFNDYGGKADNGTRYQNNEYWVGDIVDSRTFAPTSRGILDFGMLYAARTGSSATSSLDGTERRVIFGATGWAPPRSLPGCQPHTSMQIELLPRDLGIDAKGRLTISPIPELVTLRKPGGRQTSAWLPSANSGDQLSAPVAHGSAATGSLLDLRMTCEGRPRSGAGAAGSQSSRDTVAMHVLVAAGGASFTAIGYNYSSSQLFIDHRHSSTRCPDRVICGPGAIVQTAPLQGGGLDEGEPVELRVMLDGGLVEAYLNKRTVMSVWVVEVMNQTAAAHTPPSRTAAALTPPPGVTCHWESHELQALSPVPK